MRKFISICALAALAACSGSEEDPAAPADEVSVEEPAETMAGTYTGTTEDGEAWTSVLREDGTYEDTMNGEVTQSGNWAEVGEQICFYPTVEEGAEAEEDCYTMGEMTADGTFEATNSEGETATITKVS